MIFVTSDDRVAEVIEEVAAWTNTKKGDVPFDLMVTPLATGSKDYIEWVKVQTLKKDDDTAYFNEKPEAALKPLEDTVEENEHVQVASDETKSPWYSDPEDDE